MLFRSVTPIPQKSESSNNELMDDLFGEGINLDDEEEEDIKQQEKASTPPKEIKTKNSPINIDNNAVKLGNKEVSDGIEATLKTVEPVLKQKNSNKNTPPNFVAQ